MNTKDRNIKQLMRRFGIFMKKMSENSMDKLSESQQAKRDAAFDQYYKAVSRNFIAKKMRGGFQNNAKKY